MATGYVGRTSIHELFLLDDEMHRVIMEGADATTLHITARRQGMITLYEDGLRKVVQGLTSLEEVMRITQDQSQDDGLPESAGSSDARAGECHRPDAGFFYKAVGRDGKAQQG